MSLKGVLSASASPSSPGDRGRVSAGWLGDLTRLKADFTGSRKLIGAEGSWRGVARDCRRFLIWVVRVHSVLDRSGSHCQALTSAISRSEIDFTGVAISGFSSFSSPTSALTGAGVGIAFRAGVGLYAPPASGLGEAGYADARTAGPPMLARERRGWLVCRATWGV